MGPGQEISGSVPCPISSAGFRPGGRGEGACAPGLEYFAARGGGGRVSPWGRGKGACAPGPEYFAACGGDLLCPLRQSRQSAAGNAADGLRLRCAPPRPIGPLFPDPCYGGILLFMDRNIPARGALSGQSQLPPGHWALMRWTAEEGGIPLPRLLRHSQCSGVVEVTTRPAPHRATCAPRHTKARPQTEEPLHREIHLCSGSGGGSNINPHPTRAFGKTIRGA